MSGVAWFAAESLVRCTGKVEVRTSGSWHWRGTAFFVGGTTLLTCAHVVSKSDEVRVVLYVPPESSERLGGSASTGGRIMGLPVTVANRCPDLNERANPYPLPDVAVLRVSDSVQWLPKCSVLLDAREPGDDLWTFGYTDEYIRGQALGYSCRFQLAGTTQVDENDPRRVWRMKGDRVRGGLSGAPVLDLWSGRVIGMVKSTQDTNLPLGAYFVPMTDILPCLPEDVKSENRTINDDPASSEAAAKQLWGGLVDTAASALVGNPVARNVLAKALSLSEIDLVGDDVAQAYRVGRELFKLDLRDFLAYVRPLVERIGRNGASKLFNAVAACTSYDGEQWVAAETAAELAAQVELIAGTAPAAGRVLYLRADDELRQLYRRRANRNGTWGEPLDFGAFSHEVDAESGLPADLEWELRSEIIRKFRISQTNGLDAQVLDDAGRARWNQLRPTLISTLREQYVIGMLPPNMPLDARLVESLASDFQLVLLAAGVDLPAGASEQTAYQILDPDVDSGHAFAAFLRYEAARADLADSEGGGLQR